jgi:hypothetical protein
VGGGFFFFAGTEAKIANLLPSIASRSHADERSNKGLFFYYFFRVPESLS